MQNRTVIILLVVLSILCLLAVCVCVAAVTAWIVLAPASVETSSQPPALAGATAIPTFTALPLTPTLVSEPPAACAADMRAVIDAAESFGQDFDSPLGNSMEAAEEHPRTVTLVEYPVNGDDLGDPVIKSVEADLVPLQKDNASHTDTWRYFTTLIPAGERSMVNRFVIVTDGPSNILASVYQDEDDPGLWVIEVDAADLGDRKALMFTLVHEYAHLLTLQPSQVPPDIQIFDDPGNPSLREYRMEKCETFFPGEGCSLPDSYINAFYQSFWTDIAAAWQPVDDLGEGEDIEAYYEALYDFYEEHQDQFLTDYAATNASEDIAESFSYFIFSPRPAADSIASEKILFFYNYPELVQLRGQILHGFCEAPQ